jgi:hypothetical protein
LLLGQNTGLEQQEPEIQPMLSLITTCKNRLPHLKQTLPLMLQQPRAEVVDDYGYDQGTASWVREQHPAKSTMIRSLALREREIWVQEMPPMRRIVLMEGQNPLKYRSMFRCIQNTTSI